MKFSIVTCTWNSVKTLAETIDSVQSQAVGTVEHIFVDGGSTDGTLEVIAQRCPEAKVLKDVKGGISRAMNAGIEVATGDLIAHLHSDDYYAATDVLARVEAAFAREPASQWAYGKIQVLREGTLTSADYPMQPFTFGRYAAGRISVPHPAAFVRRVAFGAIGVFDESLKYAMDIDLWLRLGRYHVPIQIDSPLTVFREHEGSLSTANKWQAQQEEWQVRRAYLTQAPMATLRFGLRHLRRAACAHRLGSGS